MCSVTGITVDYYFSLCVDFNLPSLKYELAYWKVRVSVMYFRTCTGVWRQMQPLYYSKIMSIPFLYFMRPLPPSPTKPHQATKDAQQQGHRGECLRGHWLLCSHSCRMGRLHSWGQPGEVTLTVLKSCSPQELWWTWLSRWVSDTMSIGNMLDITRGRAAASGYSSRLVCLFVCDTVYSPGFHSTVFTAWIASHKLLVFRFWC